MGLAVRECDSASMPVRPSGVKAVWPVKAAMTIPTHSRLAADARALCLLALPLSPHLSIIACSSPIRDGLGSSVRADLAALSVGVGFYPFSC